MNVNAIYLEPRSPAYSTPMIENKREKGTNRPKGYLCSRVSWLNLITVPLVGVMANFVLLRRTTAN
jgi:hypothetical protein